MAKAPSPPCTRRNISQFLENIHARWSRMPGAAPAVTPNIHPNRRDGAYPASAVAQAGWHMADASCPIAEGTWESACWSAWSAVHAAEHGAGR